MSTHGPDGAKWGDLTTRILSALVLSTVALAALFLGPVTWGLAAFLILGVMLWELGPLCEPGLGATRRALLASAPLPAAVIYLLAAVNALAAGAGYAAMAPWVMPADFVVPLGAYLLLAPLGGWALLRRGRLLWSGYGALVAGATLMLIWLGNAQGPGAVLALIGIVVVSDTAGYFAGRLIGGPKFWPRVSPKKTWSGTIAGWVGAGVLGWFVGPGFALAPWAAAIVAVLLAFAGQMGDVIESAMKRRVGVKDASNLIPGHGGFLDRMDALVAAAAVAGLLALLYAI